MCIFGFRRKRCVLEVVGTIRQVLATAAIWNIPVVVAQGDVKAAFDNMTHDNIVSSLEQRGAHPFIIAAFLRELMNTVAIATYASVSSGEFQYSLGGRQGGTDTPSLWNEIVYTIVNPLDRSWRDRGFGIEVESGTSKQNTCNI